MEKISSTKIHIPEIIIEKKTIGKNAVFQIAHFSKKIEVDVYNFNQSCFLLIDKNNNRYYLQLSNAKDKIKRKEVLIAKDLFSISDLNENSKLEWIFTNKYKITKVPTEIIDSWKNSFSFKEHTDRNYGLRKPQLGAIHAIASYWSLNKKCGTVIMPTGTGKTETMISILVYKQCNKVLIIVPSNSLRDQISNKFLSLGCLREINAVKENVLNPRVGVIKHGIHSLEEVKNLLENSNVIVATVKALTTFPDNVVKVIVDECSHLFIDEAHHVSASTWNSIKELFKEKSILQFTATPFRRDGKQIEGDIIYNYPLGMAQDDGYFKQINLIEVLEFDDLKADEEIAKAAINILKNDLFHTPPKDHIVMARCQNRNRANQILQIYQKLSPEFNPININSDLSISKYNEAISKLLSRQTRIIICVDMLGEGFDLPNLKIAALHDVHKSLAITLQFIGRFTRVTKNVGNASVVVNLSDPNVSKEIEDLYAEGADWDKLIKQKSETTIEREINFQEFIKGFKGELSKYISLWNLRPSFSTVIYETDTAKWYPQKFIEVISKNYEYIHAINKKEKILVILIRREDEVSWGKYKGIKNLNFDLCVAHWSEAHNALFLYFSDYDAINNNQLAKKLCGDKVKLKSGSKVFNIFSGVERVLARNLGISTIGNISYTMHFGSDITNGLTKLDKSLGILNNIFGWGYENGKRIAEGCSAKKGKIWARGGGSINLWKEWCYKIATKVFDNTLEEHSIIQDFLRPIELNERYEGIPISIQWSENLLKTPEENVSIIFGKHEFKMFEVEMEIENSNSQGDIIFNIFSETEKTSYRMKIIDKECTYKKVSGNEIKIRKFNGDSIPFADYMEKDPVTIVYSDGSFSYNSFHVPTPSPNTFFDTEHLNIVDWSNTDIKIESMGMEGKTNSIQYKTFNLFKEEYEVLFNDDAPGEAADIVAIRKDSKDTFKLHLIHCKFSSHKPGAQVNDFYTLCGQAQKCIRWKHNGMEYLVNHMKKREAVWQKLGKTRFLKGSLGELNKLKKFSRFATNFVFEVSIVQPGLLKDKISPDIIQLLANTEDYLSKTSSARLSVFCS